MNTIVIQVGNTDNKLTQQQWASFVNLIDEHLRGLSWGACLHFRGGSLPDAAWQNFCWVVTPPSLDDLRARLADAAQVFGQDSIALTLGSTEFVAAKPL